MTRRIALTATTLVVAALAVAPAHAAGGKVLKGSYAVTLTPDPTLEVANACEAVVPTSKDDHPLTVPGAGTLSVVLDAPDPAGQGDWDLWILDADGSASSGSSGGTAHEETSVKTKKSQKLTIQVCNLAGAPNGTVSWTFTPKK
jgi:hypothetical protein